MNLNSHDIIRNYGKNVPFTDKEVIDTIHNLDPENFDRFGNFIPPKIEGDRYTYDNNKTYREVCSLFPRLYVLNAIKQAVFGDTKSKLCDIGCGIGTTVYFAEKMGFDAIGVEKQTILKKFHDKLNIKVIYGDFFNMDFSFLKDMDVIYLFRPIKDEKISDKLLNKIYRNTKKDVIIYYNLSHLRIDNALLKKLKFIGRGMPYGGDDIYMKK